jgi:hypothetical protein
VESIGKSVRIVLIRPRVARDVGRDKACAELARHRSQRASLVR